MAETSRTELQKGNTVSKEGKRETLYVDFLFFKVDPRFRRLPAAEKEEGTSAFRDVLQRLPQGFKIRPYLSLGFRPETDFLLWVVTPDLEEVQKFVTRLLRTGLGKYLHLVYSYAAVRQPPLYAATHQQQFEKDEPPGRFLFVYPFVKSREWYLLPMEKRQEVMNEHMRVAREFAMVRLNTTYSFGLGDQDFILAFEADEPEDFEKLVQRLRETESSRYTVRDTPMIVCTAQKTVESLIEGLAL